MYRSYYEEYFKAFNGIKSECEKFKTISRADKDGLIILSKHHADSLTKEGLLLASLALLESLLSNLTDNKTFDYLTNKDKYDDPYEMVMELTNPCEEITLDEAKKLLKEAVAKGWRIPPEFTAEEFIEIYKDCEPLEEE